MPTLTAATQPFIFEVRKGSDRMLVTVKVRQGDTPASLQRRLEGNGVTASLEALQRAAGVSDAHSRLAPADLTVDVVVREGLDAAAAGIILNRHQGSAGSPQSLLSTQIDEQKSRGVSGGTDDGDGLSSYRSSNRVKMRGLRHFVSSLFSADTIERIYSRLAFTNSWNVGRDFTTYCSMLGEHRKELVRRLATHGPDQIWGDLGAGRGRAMRQLFRVGPMAPEEAKQSQPDDPTLEHALHWRFSPSNPADRKLFEDLEKTRTSVALFNYKNPLGTHLDRLRRLVRHRDRRARLFNYTGDFHTLKLERVPKMDILTDVVGVGTYSQDYGRYLRQVHELLKPGGVLMTTVDYGTEFFIEGPEGRRRVPVSEFFAALPGFSSENVGNAPNVALTKIGEPFGAPRIETVFEVAEDLQADPVPNREITLFV